MKKIIVLAFLFSIAIPAQRISAKVVDRTVAIVNGENILLSDFEKVCNSTVEQYKTFVSSKDQTSEKIKELKKEILDQMINEKIIVQEAKKQKLAVTQREMEELKEKLPSEDGLKAEFLKGEITKKEFEDKIKEYLMATKFINKEIKGKVGLPTEEETKELFDIIMKKIDGRDIPATKYNSKDIEGLAKLIKRAFGDLVHARHILIAVPRNSSMKEKINAKKTTEEIKQKLDKGEDFGDLAMKYSDDPGSSQNGGDLGFFGRDEMVPEFEKVAFSLNVGSTSDIIETEFGYHIIKVEAKKASRKVNYDEVKNDLMHYIFEKKAEKKYGDWIVELRAKSAIKINPID